MKIFNTLALAGATAVLAMGATQASAASFVLDFEGVGDFASVNEFYNGGTDSGGHSGTNYGVSFSSSSLALIDNDAGGSGNIANEPSGQTVLFFLSSTALLNTTAGFDTGFSFFYSSAATATVNVWSGLNATGDLLATISLSGQYNSNNCQGDPNGQFCNWTAAGATFAGMAHSIDFGGTANQIVFDNITFGSADAGGSAAPEPSSWAMMLGGFGLLGATMRRRKASMTLA